MSLKRNLKALGVTLEHVVVIGGKFFFVDKNKISQFTTSCWGESTWIQYLVTDGFQNVDLFFKFVVPFQKNLICFCLLAECPWKTQKCLHSCS
jgi:hypothetical protein